MREDCDRLRFHHLRRRFGPRDRLSQDYISYKLMLVYCSTWHLKVDGDSFSHTADGKHR